jgi:hypothetical protein
VAQWQCHRDAYNMPLLLLKCQWAQCRLYCQAALDSEVSRRLLLRVLSTGIARVAQADSDTQWQPRSGTPCCHGPTGSTLGLKLPVPVTRGRVPSRPFTVTVLLNLKLLRSSLTGMLSGKAAADSESDSDAQAARHGASVHTCRLSVRGPRRPGPAHSHSNLKAASVRVSGSSHASAFITVTNLNTRRLRVGGPRAVHDETSRVKVNVLVKVRPLALS